jgi:hypothetical protein
VTGNRFSLFRFVALAAFIVAVAVGLWLYAPEWYLIVATMTAALLIAWTIEWLAWRDPRGTWPAGDRQVEQPERRGHVTRVPNAAQEEARVTASPPEDPLRSEVRPDPLHEPPEPAPPDPRAAAAASTPTRSWRAWMRSTANRPERAPSSAEGAADERAEVRRKLPVSGATVPAAPEPPVSLEELEPEREAVGPTPPDVEPHAVPEPPADDVSTAVPEPEADPEARAVDEPESTRAAEAPADDHSQPSAEAIPERREPAALAATPEEEVEVRIAAEPEPELQAEALPPAEAPEREAEPEPEHEAKAEPEPASEDDEDSAPVADAESTPSAREAPALPEADDAVPPSAPAERPRLPPAPPRRPARPPVRAASAPPPAPPPARPAPSRPDPRAAPAGAPVVTLPRRAAEPREWNVWELDALAREASRRAPERATEWSYLLLHLREFADPGGALPSEFDAVVRESFGGFLERIDR